MKFSVVLKALIFTLLLAGVCPAQGQDGRFSIPGRDPVEVYERPLFFNRAFDYSSRDVRIGINKIDWDRSATPTNPFRIWIEAQRPNGELIKKFGVAEGEVYVTNCPADGAVFLKAERIDRNRTVKPGSVIYRVW